MLVDLDLDGKNAVVLGGGREAQLKAEKLVDAGASTTVVARRLTKGLRLLSKTGMVKVVRMDPVDSRGLITKLKPKVLFVSTGALSTDEKLAGLGRSLGILVCVVDEPRLNDFNMPALAKIGTLRVAISTGGKSPAMAKLIRERVERTITAEDLLQIELQSSVRDEIRKEFGTRSARKAMVYRMIKDPEISRVLREEGLESARILAKTMMKTSKRSIKRH